MWREALSARLDGEEFSGEWAGQPAHDPRALDAHLATCESCSRWYADASLLTRLYRVDVSVPAGEGVPQAVLESAPGPGRARLAQALRVVLALLGAGQILLAVGELAGPMTVSATPMHLTHEFAAWNAAIGASFLFISWRRTRPAALVPLLAAFVGVLTVLSVDDMVHGTVGASRLVSHLLIVAGFAVVVAMSRPSLTFDAPPGARERFRSSAWRLQPDDLGDVDRDESARRVAADGEGAQPPAASIERHAA
jgi:predicted anti-sigma-YlaC factor YlaD